MYETLTDKRAILNTIGCLMLDPTLIDDIDRPLDRTDFDTEALYELLYVAIFNSYMQGVKDINEFTIDSYLSSYKEQYEIFQTNDGLNYLTSAREMSSLDNYDYYYHRLRKYSLLRYYEKKGYNTKSIFDPTVSVEELTKEMEKFDNYTEQDIVGMVETDLVISPTIKYCTNMLTTEIQAADDAMDLIESFMKIPDVGVPLNNNGLNTVARGARKGCLYMRSLPQGGGKAIPNYTIIPTPTGNKRVDEIKVGDYLFGKNGKPVKVLAVHPQLEKKRIYKIGFTDGRVAECCEDHLWTFKKGSYEKYRTASLKDIIKDVEHSRYGLHSMEGKGHLYYIPVNEPIEFSEKEYSIPPYIMGLLLGDGCFRYTYSNKEMSYSSEDDYLPNIIAQTMGWILSKNSDHNYTYTFKYQKPIHDSTTGKEYIRVRVTDVLQNYPNLIQKYSHEKYIPEDYLTGSVEQRMELLRGLLDTDGSVGAKGRVSFCTVSPLLRNNIMWLIRSLGFICTCSEDNRRTRTCYNVRIQASLDKKIDMFKLNKHRNKIIAWKEQSKNKKIKYRRNTISIDYIIPTDEYTDMTCFTVDADDSLFLMNDFIVTHNTRFAAGDACKMAVPYYYDKKKKEFVYTGMAEPTLYITTEMTVDEIQTMLVASVSRVNEEHILYGEYKEGELERVKQAITYIKSAPLYIVHIPDFSIEDIKNIIKKYNREFKVEYFFFDYISTSLRLMQEVSGKSRMGLKEHQLLLVFSTELKTIAQQLGVFIFTASQLNGEAQNALVKDQNLLAGAKALANKLDVGIISMHPTQRERDKLDAIIQTHFGLQMPDVGHWVYKVRRGRLTHIIIWSQIDLGTMDEKALFVTDFNFNLIDIDFTQIEQVEAKIQEHSVLESQVHDEEPEIVNSTAIKVEPEAIEEEQTIKRDFDW